MERSPQEWKAIADNAADTKLNLMADKAGILAQSAKKVHLAKDNHLSALNAEPDFDPTWDATSQAEPLESPWEEGTRLKAEEAAAEQARARAMAAMEEQEHPLDLPAERTHYGVRNPLLDKKERPQPPAAI